MSEHGQSTGFMPRRQALCSLVALGVLGPAALAACSTDDEPGRAASSSPPSGAPDDPPAVPVAQLSKVPVGSGTVVTAPDGRALVITQPTTGKVVAYDASCTHQGIPVGAPDGQGVMTCPQHNSRFRAADGSVVNGPATKPLQTVAVNVQGDDITLA